MKKDLRSENVKKIAEDFPMCITEIKDKDGNLKKVIDFEKLKELLTGELRDREEAYEFTWAGKREALRKAFEYNDKILRPVVEDSLNFFDTQNIYIEGDNLEVLKILRSSYFEKVKMIYIDPPYNTGHDFIYKDDFKKSKKEYDEEQEVYDEEGNKLQENKESDGRFHSNWCSMIYSRLLLARDLLRPDGVIFISIDDNEVASLRKICDEVFGEDNFICQFIWNCSTAGGIRPKFASKTHEYILFYAKVKNNLSTLYAPLSNEAKKLYDKKDDKGLYRDKDFVFKNSSTNINQKYIIECPDGEKVHPKEGYIYRYILETFLEAKKNGLVTFKRTKTNPLLNEKEEQANWNIYIKKYLGNAMGAPSTLIPKDLISIYNAGTQIVQSLFNDKRVFENVKPVDLDHFLTNMISPPPKSGVDVPEQPLQGDIILDFFSGSATTAHAVMQLNAEDNGNRKYIMVQIPEKCDEKSEAYKAGYENICEIGKERIRRAGKKIKEETNANIDYGFKVFKVDSSNFKEEISVPADEFDFKNLENCIENIKEDRTPLDLVYQCILSLGKELTLPIKTENIDGFTVYNVDNFSIMCCFDENISDEVMKYMADKEPESVYFRDSCFRDLSHKLNVKEYFKVMSETTRFEDV